MGNTSCKYSLCIDGHLGPIVRDDGSDVAGTARAVSDGVAPDIVVLSSVRERNLLCEEELSSIGRRFLSISSNTSLPISLGYDTPETLGPDRIAAAAGVFSMFRGEDILLFDFGTAITIDRVTAEGIFAGGNISIGLKSRLKALNLLTARLPEVPLECGGKVGFGKSTAEALVSGAVSGTMFEVEGYINSCPGHKIVFSGGDSIFLAKRMKCPIFADYNLVLKGLAYIAEYNAQM